jgi:hypothetical protein
MGISNKGRELLDGLFGELKDSIDAISDACTKYDSAISLGMAARTEELMKETYNTAYSWLHTLLDSTLTKLLATFNKFVVWLMKS